VAVLLLKLPVKTIGTRFGEFPAALPSLQMPEFHLSTLPHLFVPALTVAMLGAIESLMSAVVADRMTGDRHNPNIELDRPGCRQYRFAVIRRTPGHRRHRPHRHQRPRRRANAGLRNDSMRSRCWQSCFSPRTLLVHSSGGSVRHSVGGGVQHGRMARDPPVVEAHQIRHCGLAGHVHPHVFADLTIAVEVGMILAALLFIQKVATTTTVSQVTRDTSNTAARTCFRTSTSRIRHGLSHSRPVPVRRHGQDPGDPGSASPNSSRCSSCGCAT